MGGSVKKSKDGSSRSPRLQPSTIWRGDVEARGDAMSWDGHRNLGEEGGLERRGRRRSEGKGESVEDERAKTPRSIQGKSGDRHGGADGSTPKLAQRKLIGGEKKSKGSPSLGDRLVKGVVDIPDSPMAIPKDDFEPACLVYSRDGKILLASCGNSVDALSVPAGGSTLFTLGGHKGLVTGVALLPTVYGGLSSSQRVLTSSLDGTLRVWDLGDGGAIKVIKVGLPIRDMLLSPDGAKAYICTLKVPSQPPNHGKDGVAMCGTPGGKCGKKGRDEKPASYVQEIVLDSPKLQMRRLFKCRHVARLSVTEDGILVAGAKKDVFVWREGAVEPAKLKHDRNIKTVAVHSEQRFVASADERGEIFLWYNALEQGENEPVRSSQMHWHSKAVRAICVSVEGAYLFSGGEESVLVIWQLGSGQRSFLPRLGGTIQAICVSPDGTQVSVMCEGGKVKVIDIQTRKVIRNFRIASATFSTPAIMDGSRILCTAGGAGLVGASGVGTEVMVWDVKGAMVGHLEVLPRNFLAKGDKGDGKESTTVKVTVATFSSDGESLAVVHGTEKGSNKDSRFQLSMWRVTQGRWQVESRVLSPHTSAVTSVNFARQSTKGAANLLISSGNDGFFKIWRREARQTALSVNNRKIDAVDYTWRCQSVCCIRPTICGSATFSPDGSVVAAAYTHSICICAYPSLGLLSAMTNLACKQPITHVSFVPGSTCLVSATASSVALWDITTSMLRWSYSLSALAIAVHPILPQIAISAKGMAVEGEGGKGHVLLCGVDSAVPTHTWELESGEGGGLLWSSRMRGGSKGGERLLIMQSKGFSPLDWGRSERDAKQQVEKRKSGAEATTEMSAFERMTAAGAYAGCGKKAPIFVTGSSGGAVAITLLEGPSYVLAAPSALHRTFLLAMLPGLGVVGASEGAEKGESERERNGKMGNLQGIEEQEKGGVGSIQKVKGEKIVLDQEDDEEASFEIPHALNIFAKSMHSLN